jgi:hypothetical protein
MKRESSQAAYQHGRFHAILTISLSRSCSFRDVINAKCGIGENLLETISPHFVINVTPTKQVKSASRL